MPTQLNTLLLHPNKFKATIFTPSQKFLVSLKSFFTSSHPSRGRPVFPLALDLNSWPKRTIMGSLTSFIQRTCLSHHNLYLITALESGIERAVSRVSKTIRSQFLWKTFSKSSSVFRSAQASEPYLAIVISVASNILILIRRIMFLFF